MLNFLRKSTLGCLLAVTLLLGGSAYADAPAKLAFAAFLAPDTITTDSDRSLLFCLVNRGGEVVGPNMRLLSEYFIGYSVTTPGAFVGGAYAFLVAFVGAYSFAKLRDVLVRWSLRLAWRRSQRRASRNLLDHMT